MHTADNGTNAPPVALLAGVVQMSAVVQICVGTVGQAGTVTPEYVAWWLVLRQSSVDEVHSIIQVSIARKMHELTQDDSVAATQTSQLIRKGK